MDEYKIKYFSESDSCWYCYDDAKRIWVNVCPGSVLPMDVCNRLAQDYIKLLLKVKE